MSAQPSHKEREHSDFPPSSMGRLITCPASWSRCRGLEREETDVMREGTLAHAVLENQLKGRAPSDWILPAGAKHRDVTTEMRTAVAVCVDEVQRLRDEWPGEEGIEARASLNPWDLVEIWGTADYVLKRRYDRIVVLDYKHGKGVFVPANDYQFWTYAAGVVGPKEMSLYGELELVVVQPRCREGEPVRRVVVPMSALSDYVHGVLKPAIADAKSATPKVNPTEEGCRWCDAKMARNADGSWRCPEYHDKALAVAGLEFADLATPTPIASPPVPTDPGLLGKLYKQLPLLKQWVKQVEAAVAAATKEGKPTGLKFVAGKASRSWKNETEVTTFLRQEYELDDEDLYTPATLKSPAALETLIPGGKKILAPFVQKTAGKPTLADQNDKRPAVDAALTDFKDLQGEEL